MNNQKPLVFALTQETKIIIQLGFDFRNVGLKGKYLSSAVKKEKD